MLFFIRNIFIQAAAAAPGANGGAEFNRVEIVSASELGFWLIFAGCAALAVALVFSVLGGRELKDARRASLISALRTAALLVALLLLFKPAVEMQRVEREKGKVAVLLKKPVKPRKSGLGFTQVDHIRD